VYNLRNRSFLKELDFSRDELLHLLRLAEALKTAKYAGNEAPRLAGKEIALIFEKSSTRTRCAFEVAAFDQGGHVTYLDPSGSQPGHKESIADTARVLGRMFDAIEYRGAGQENVEELARHAGVPVYNGLTDEWHPAQMLADFLTMHERSGRPYDAITYAFVGDGRYNMGRSLLITGAIMGSDVRLVVPAVLRPPAGVVERAYELAAASGARITITDDVAAGVEGADFVHTDVWVSMGEPKEVWTERAQLLAPYQVNADLLAATKNPKVKFMHCLPAYHGAKTTVGREIAAATGMNDGLEVTDEVFRVTGQHRVRRGGEPAAHDQGRARRHARVSITVPALRGIPAPMARSRRR
jgi:ornithine carbamoyltransferase